MCLARTGLAAVARTGMEFGGEDWRRRQQVEGSLLMDYEA